MDHLLSATGIDSHAHVFTRQLAIQDARRAPQGYDATPDRYLALLRANGLAGGVLVQPSFLGTDNGYLLAALQAHPRQLRGVAVVQPGIDTGALQQMHRAGVVGIRLNLIGLPVPDFSSPGWRSLLGALQRLEWHVEVHQHAARLAPVLGPLLAAGLDVVVDHFGRPDPRLGVDDPGFRHLLSLADSGRVWVKLSGAYRNGGAEGSVRGEAVAQAAMPLLRTHFGLQRLVWGSDWPHTLFESAVHFEAQRRLLDGWLPAPADRQAVLLHTPAHLYRFDRDPTGDTA